MTIDEKVKAIVEEGLRDIYVKVEEAYDIDGGYLDYYADPVDVYDTIQSTLTDALTKAVHGWVESKKERAEELMSASSETLEALNGFLDLYRDYYYDGFGRGEGLDDPFDERIHDIVTSMHDLSQDMAEHMKAKGIC